MEVISIYFNLDTVSENRILKAIREDLMKHFSILSLVTAGLFLVAASPAFAETLVAGDITADTTWGLTSPDPEGEYRVTGTVTVRGGAILTIEPGVMITFNSWTGLYIGGSAVDDYGTLIADGMDTSQILLTSDSASPGAYQGIRFRSSAMDSSIMDYCVVQYGGYSTSSNIWIDSSNPTISNTIIRYSSAYGIYCLNSAAPAITQCLVHANSNHGIYLNSANAPAPVIHSCHFSNNQGYPISAYPHHIPGFSENTFTDNLYQQIYVQGGTISTDMTWEAAGIPYRMAGNLYIQGQDGADNVTSLTLEPGVTLQMASYMSIFIGHETNTAYPGALIAIGTDTEKITFTADTSTPSPGFWGGLIFQNYSDDTQCELTHCIVEYGGYGSNENIYCSAASPAMTHTESSNGSGPGLYCYNGADPIIDTCSFHDNTTYGIYAYTSSSPQIAATTIENNTSHGIYVNSDCSPSIMNSNINNNGNHGLFVNSIDCLPIVDGCMFDGNGSYPVRAYARNIVLFTNNTYQNNTNSQIYVLGDTISLDATWESPGIPYKMVGHLYIRGQDGPDNVTSLTLEPGVTMQMGSIYRIDIGNESTPDLPGALIAVGTETDTITFTADTSMPSPGFWGGIYFENYSDDSQCELTHCIVEYGGYINFENILCYAASPTITHTESAYGDGPGIYCNNGANPVIEECHVHDNTSYGIRASNFSSPQIIATTIENNSSFGIHLDSDSSPSIINSNINNNDNYGLYINSINCLPIVNGCMFDGNDSYPVRAYARNIGLFTNNTYQNNTNSQIYVIGDTISLDATWESPGIPYKITGDLTIQGQDGPDSVTSLTLQPGVTLQMASTIGIIIGHDSNSDFPGALIAVGTEAEKITFTADTSTPSPGFWDGIRFYNYSDDSLCELTHCIVEYGGYSSYENIHCYAASPIMTHTEAAYGNGPGIYCYNGSDPVIEECHVHDNTTHGIYANISSSPQITATTIENNASYGIYLNNDSSSSIMNSNINNNTSYGLYINSINCLPIVNGCLFDGNGSYPVRAYARNIGLFTNNTYQNNTSSQIYVAGDTISMDATWESPGIPYKMTGNLTIQGQDGADGVTSLTLEPGVTIQMANSASIVVGHNLNSDLPGALIAIGTDTDKIMFTADTASPAPGYWGMLDFEDFSDDSLCELTHCIVEYGGYSGTENISCHAASPTLNLCEIQYGLGIGLLCADGSSPTVNTCSIENNTQYGISCTGVGSNPTITYCIVTGNPYGLYVTSNALPVIGGTDGMGNNIEGNSVYGVRNTDSTTCINAHYNWWGDALGPDDDTFAVDDCMDDGNDNDAGDTVSEDVNYQYWASSPVGTPTQVPTVTPTACPVPSTDPQGVGLLLVLIGFILICTIRKSAA